jgi:hypothetical protein
MLVGFVWYSIVKMRSPQVLAGIAHDLETAAGAAE